ncbi:hypothetical protein V8C42DRAFT_324535 [Trichoderma barbatum]
MSSSRNVSIHQSSSGPSTASSPSRSSISSAHYSSSSRSGSTRREYDAGMLVDATISTGRNVLTRSTVGRTSEVVQSRSGKTVVINHRKTGFEMGSPSPRYGGSY